MMLLTALGHQKTVVKALHPALLAQSAETTANRKEMCCTQWLAWSSGVGEADGVALLL